MPELTRGDVWKAIAGENFMVIGMVSARGQARTAGVMHFVEDECLWFTTILDEWKARHISANPSVSVTVPIAKRIPFVPWVKIPAATITFAGEAHIVPVDQLSGAATRALLEGLDLGDESERGGLVAVRVRPTGDFVTYGVGVSVLGMRDTELARGRVPVAPGRAPALV